MSHAIEFDTLSALRHGWRAPIAGERLARAKTSYAVRRVPLEVARSLEKDGRPQPGDLVLARVTELGQHQHLEDRSGRRAKLWLGDEIVVAYGNRYAPDQFEALVPDDLGCCNLVASGGIAARVLSRHGTVRDATTIEPVGLLTDEHGTRLNLIGFRLPPFARPVLQPHTIAVCGTSMNAGKTTACTGLIRGFARIGCEVGAAKITGTGSGRDCWAMRDAGAAWVLDFSDAGYATTFGLAVKEVQAIFTSLTGHLAAAGAQVHVLEIADGLLQSETAQLVTSELFSSAVDAVIFAADSSMGAKAGVEYLRDYGLPVLAVSGVVAMSPLASREVTAATGLPVLGIDELGTGRWCAGLLRPPARLATA